MFLTLLHAIPCLYAQHVYKVEELGLSFEFPCIPEQDGGTVAVYDGYTYMHLLNCESGEDGFGIMALYIPDSRNNPGLVYGRQPYRHQSLGALFGNAENGKINMAGQPEVYRKNRIFKIRTIINQK